ncbi:prepilin peptidase [Flaviflexus huanghaiensis]|uniref:prepilin peptidase n=1 Tax=Flaviflexus huanghaiensis TaxID=1111473 RepID=UPI0015FA07D8|nr:prepilin peptidase [Flaviflexus huanghaiensis]
MNWTRGVTPLWLILGALAGAGAGLAATWTIEIAATTVVGSLLFAVLGVLFVIDARTGYLPDPWMIIAGVLVALHPIAIAVTIDPVIGGFIFLLAAVGASIGFALFSLARMLSKRQLGFGDVKLAAVLGGWLLPLGWGAIGLGFVFTTIIGALWLGVSLARGRRTAPYGPAMIMAAILATGLA